MRPILVDFLVQVHQHYKLRQESLHLAINVLDRYMSKAIVLKKHYQLVGMTCMWLAAKYEDGQDNVPKASLLCYLCCNLYDEKAFVTMEKHILKTMDWSLGHPTAEAFLQKALSELMNDDRRTQHVARFLLELTLFHACFISYGSYVVGTSCLYFARYILGISQKVCFITSVQFYSENLLVPRGLAWDGYASQLKCQYTAEFMLGHQNNGWDERNAFCLRITESIRSLSNEIYIYI